MGASGFPFGSSSPPGVSHFPAPRCPLAPDSGPTALAAFYVLISPLCSALNSSLGGGHAWERGLPLRPGWALSVI